MIPDVPTIGIRFDIDKVGGGYYGYHCWKTFWQAIEPGQITAAALYDGDTAATLSSRENVFCLVVQSPDTACLSKIKAALNASDRFKEVSATPAFIEDSSYIREPLVEAGRIDSKGDFIGDAGASSDALRDVQKEKQAAANCAVNEVTFTCPECSQHIACDESYRLFIARQVKI